MYEFVEDKISINNFIVFAMSPPFTLRCTCEISPYCVDDGLGYFLGGAKIRNTCDVNIVFSGCFLVTTR